MAKAAATDASRAKLLQIRALEEISYRNSWQQTGSLVGRKLFDLEPHQS